MIQRVIENLSPACEHRFIFVCQQEHLTRYQFRSQLLQLSPGCRIIELSELTEGSLCSVMSAASWFDDENPLMIANADQWIDSDINEFVQRLIAPSGLDGLVMTMKAKDPKWSYARQDAEGWVTHVVEKEVISDEATVGIYGFARGADFCTHARRMLASNIRSKGEFYVAPVYTLMVQSGLKRIAVHNIGSDGQEMHGLGTPQDLVMFLQNHCFAASNTKAQIL